MSQKRQKTLALGSFNDALGMQPPTFSKND